MCHCYRVVILQGLYCTQIPAQVSPIFYQANLGYLFLTSEFKTCPFDFRWKAHWDLFKANYSDMIYVQII